MRVSAVERAMRTSEVLQLSLEEIVVSRGAGQGKEASRTTLDLEPSCAPSSLLLDRFECVYGSLTAMSYAGGPSLKGIASVSAMPLSIRSSLCSSVRPLWTARCARSDHVTSKLSIYR